MQLLRKHNWIAGIVGFSSVVAIAVVAQSGRAAPADASAEAHPAKIAASVREQTMHGREALVTAFLADNSFLANIPGSATRMLTPTQSSAARQAAQALPFKRSDSELAAASIAENSRNAALPMVRAAAAGSVEQSERIKTALERAGGYVISASPIPNQVTARVGRAALVQLAKSAEVIRVVPAELPIEMAAPIDGSATWWANGFFGQGPSVDGNGSPDVVVFDTGTRVTHTAFKSRLAGDCGTCDGSGPSRVISPLARTHFGGSKHSNTIAAEIGGTALSFPAQGGIAYGLDKLYDNFEANNPYLWDLGITSSGDPGLGGNADLPEAINYSAGIYEDQIDMNTDWRYFDALETRFGILNSVSAGNCGIQTSSFDGCSDGPHRVSTPSTNYNVITVGGLDTTTTYPDTSGYIPWANTSPGPTWGGRKKPDVIAPVFGTAGTPSQIDDNTWTSGGSGTSYAAPIAAAGSMLLASVGVYRPEAQKAIMINSATPVQGQTYWMPRTGWGALNLSNAFFQRGNYVNASVSGAGANGARFFQITGASSGDRSTLVWNRRTDVDSLPSPTNGQILGPGYFNLTNLDLSQIDPSTQAATATGGSDAGDFVDTSQTVSSDNPMPGNGTDGGDNVEQVRSTAAGTQILKVKSLSAVDGASEEPFSVASARPIAALQTPIPEVDLSPSVSATPIGSNVTITATVDNPSNSLPLTSVALTPTLPAGVTLTSSAPPILLGTIAPGSSASTTFTVQGSADGIKSISATAAGMTYGEQFSGADSTDVTVDSSPPVVDLTELPTWSHLDSPTAEWSATDTLSGVDSYDIESQLDEGTWVPLATDTVQTSALLSAAEGHAIAVRVRARDNLGNVSDWSQTQTTIDAIPPAIDFGSPLNLGGGTISVAVSVSNVGAPIVSSDYTFNSSSGGMFGALTPTVTFTNLGTSAIRPTLTVNTHDAGGRTTTKSSEFTAPPKWLPLGLKLTQAKPGKGRVALGGTLASGYTGKVAITIKRRGSQGTKRASRTVRPKSGRFHTVFRLKRGTYRITVATFEKGNYLESVVRKTVRVKKQ